MGFAQWVINDGEFKLDYSWLVLPKQGAEFAEKANE